MFYSALIADCDSFFALVVGLNFAFVFLDETGKLKSIVEMLYNKVEIIEKEKVNMFQREHNVNWAKTILKAAKETKGKDGNNTLQKLTERLVDRAKKCEKRIEKQTNHSFTNMVRGRVKKFSTLSIICGCYALMLLFFAPHIQGDINYTSLNMIILMIVVVIWFLSPSVLGKLLVSESKLKIASIIILLSVIILSFNFSDWFMARTPSFLLSHHTFIAELVSLSSFALFFACFFYYNRLLCHLYLSIQDSLILQKLASIDKLTRKLSLEGGTMSSPPGTDNMKCVIN